ncbi:MAG TPA: tol-pal system protein YbgF [Kofleriaceae bacterium]|nr:tol-pal system protein YbgF [Kofleriaceae bacterium]
MSQLKADNRQLTVELVELRADHRAQDRKIRDLEHQLAMQKELEVVPDMPKLPVEVIAPPAAQPAPGAERVVGVAADGGEIIYEGDAALGRSTTVPAPRPVAPIDDAPRKSVAAARATRAHVRDIAPATSTSNDAASADYRAAIELVKAGKHGEAQAALHAFLKTYPRHDYADNAQYWLGEDFYAQKDFPHALAEFRATIETYPRGNKVPDALLKVGYCYQALGQTEKARAVLEQVVSLYPKSEPAALASSRLQQARVETP